MIVMKFGGSSVESAVAIRRVLSIVAAHLDRKPVVVVSALARVTDQLLNLANNLGVPEGNHAQKLLARIIERHHRCAARLLRGLTLVDFVNLLHSHGGAIARLVSVANHKLVPKAQLIDEITSYGEQLSSQLLTAALKSVGIDATHLDARKLIRTNDQYTMAVPLLSESFGLIRTAVARSRGVAVVGGFIGATADGKTTTLGRGGSDLTAAVIGAAISADEIQMWKDVDGILTCDPRICSGGLRVKKISYSEAIEVARCGAKVLHSDTVVPAMHQGIPIVIRNSRRPEAEGTHIVRDSLTGRNPVKTIVYKNGINLLTAKISPNVPASHLLQELVRLCEEKNILVELASSGRGIVWIGFRGKCPGSVRNRLQNCMESCSECTIAIVSLIGEGISLLPGLINFATARIAEQCPLLLVHNSSASAIRFGVPAQHVNTVVKLLHQQCVLTMRWLELSGMTGDSMVLPLAIGNVAPPSGSGVSPAAMQTSMPRAQRQTGPK